MPFKIDVLRPDDLVALEIELRNFALDKSDRERPRLKVVKPADPAYLIVRFPQQSVLEQAYFETSNIADPPFNPVQPASPGNENPQPPGQVGSRLSGDSVLVFRATPQVTELPYTVEALLDWSRFTLVVSPLAEGRQIRPPIKAPTDLQTAIELPYRLIISPDASAGWAHRVEPLTYAGRTELWHTRLGRFVDKAGDVVVREASAANPVPMRAIWSPDFVDHQPLWPANLEKPFRAPINPNDREQLVILTSGSVGYEVAGTLSVLPYTPKPFHANRLFLSTLGGWLTSRGQWPDPPFYPITPPPRQGPAEQQLDLVEWYHVATLGRDHYVRLVYEGYLFPFGHAASLVKVTERKVYPPGVFPGVTTPTAYLRQRMYVVVRQHEINYNTALFTYQGRELPFWQSIKITTEVTPDIDPPPGPPADGDAFWIQVGGANFAFHCRGIDLVGKSVNFLAPLLFVSRSEASIQSVLATYRAAGAARACTMKGEAIAYADPSSGDTSLKTTSLVFDAEVLQDAGPFASAPFLPVLSEASVNNRALDQLLGTNSGVTISLYQGYLANNLDANAGVFAAITSAPLGVALSASQAGGLASPAFNVTGFSARKGLVSGSALYPDPAAGLGDAAAGLIEPGKFFTISAQLFGTVPLQFLVPVDSGNKADAARNAPVVKVHELPNKKNPTSVVTQISWNPAIKSSDTITFSSRSALTLKTVLTRSLVGGAPSSNINGKLTAFTVTLAGMMVVAFDEITFTSQNGSKTNVVAHLAKKNAITFQGALGFVQQLAEVLPPGLFGGSGPSIDLQPTQLHVSYTIGLPPLSLGVFTLENISITAGLDLPYLDGKPAIEFAFATRSRPFLLTIECLGGGGFVHVVLDTGGVRMVEGALEFGGEFAFDIGVASGGVHVMAGIYFQLGSNKTVLTGFVDLGGEVSVLGIISVSIDLNLSLSYIVQGSKKTVQGRATLTVSVHVLFFSASVQISVEKSFDAGSYGPRMFEVISFADWAEYASAFA